MDNEKIQSELRKAQRQFIENARASASRLQKISQRKKLSEEDFDWLKNVSHKLAGSGKTFGFELLSQAASVLETATRSASHDKNSAPPLSTELLINEILLLSDEINQAELAQTESGKPLLSRSLPKVRRGQRVYLLEDDLDLASHLAAELRVEGFEIDLFATVDDIDRAVKNYVPVAILADIVLEEEDGTSIEWVEKINANVVPPIPVVFISRKGDFETRLKAIRAGANYYLQKPINQQLLTEILHECIHQIPKTPYRILIIDDDEFLSQAFRLELMQQGMAVEIINDPLKAIDALESFKPELILLDLYMPGCNGLELGQMIRQWPKYAMIPIIFLSVETDTRKQLSAFRLAGDDFIVKPVQPWQLGMKVQTRVKHARMAGIYTKSIVDTLDHHELHDQLTGLPNRNALELHLNDAIAKSAATNLARIAVLWIDIDDFARINDLIGHEAGDQLIIEVGRRIHSVLRPGDYLSHSGGDSFVAVISEKDFSGKKLAEEVLADGIKSGGEGSQQVGALNVVGVCEMIKQVCSPAFKIDEHDYTISVSIGVSIYPDHSENAHSLFKTADMALHDAKNKGKNVYSIFRKEMSRVLTRQILISSKLRNALQKPHDLYLMYQPKYTVDGKQLIGSEALIRWKDDKLGQVSPDEFISIAEQSDLIIELGDWVVRQVCKQIREWRQAGLQVPKIALNLSARDFIAPDFVEKLFAITEAFGVERHLLELELTERTIAHHETQIIKTLNELTEAGFSIAIDDFGTGYSSLAYLKKLPISLLKIDASFIRNLPADKDDCAITETIIKLAQALSVDVLAECVETKAQAAFLQDKGCQFVQGYLYAKPLQTEAFTALISSTNHKL